VTNFGLFESARHFAAWLGLVPRQYSTGGKTHLGRITKTGNREIRTSLVLEATSMGVPGATLERRGRRMDAGSTGMASCQTGDRGAGVQNGAHCIGGETEVTSANSQGYAAHRGGAILSGSAAVVS